MGDAAGDRLSDAGSIPARSIFKAVEIADTGIIPRL